MYCKIENDIITSLSSKNNGGVLISKIGLLEIGKLVTSLEIIGQINGEDLYEIICIKTQEQIDNELDTAIRTKLARLREIKKLIRTYGGNVGDLDESLVDDADEQEVAELIAEGQAIKLELQGYKTTYGVQFVKDIANSLFA